MSHIAKKDLPAFVRRCWQAWKTANIQVRDAEKERLQFYVGGDLQWRDQELTKRKNSKRPWVTINKCKPAVDQIEGDIRQNPPGPQCHPVGGGADADTADIIEGLIREVEYRSRAKTAYSTAAKYSAASGYGVLSLETEYVDDRSFEQQLVVDSIEDPNTVFFDPTSRRANREDAMWAGQLMVYNRQEYIAEFGANRKILKPRGEQSMRGWIAEAMGSMLGEVQSALGYQGEMAQFNEWVGGAKGQGPYYVAKFYMVEIERTKLIEYSDHISRFKDEPVPEGVKAKEGDQYSRDVARRTIVKYVVDALEVLDETDWLGDIIPLFPVLGPEIYIEGKLYRLSLIAGAIDAQRALNYVASTATELAGILPKSPFIGAKGQFDDPRWQVVNSEVFAFMEYVPVFATDETTGQQQLVPPPQRNMWEAPIQWLLALAAYFSDSIKAVTAIYDPSLGAQKGDQSGVALEQLRSESNVGNFSYSDNLHRAIEIMYNQMTKIFPQLYKGSRVVTIVQPDSQHEIVEINQVFSGEGPAPKDFKANHIAIGRYAVRCNAGPSFETRQDAAIEALTNFFKAAPQALAIPGVAARFLRMIGEGNPAVEGMADLLEPQTGQQGEVTPAQFQQLQQQSQLQQALIQKMHQAIQAKLPEIEAKKWQVALEQLVKLRVAEITASKDADNQKADTAASLLETLIGMAHETGLQHADQTHQAQLQDSQQQAASASQTQAEQAAAENQPEPAVQ